MDFKVFTCCCVKQPGGCTLSGVARHNSSGRQIGPRAARGDQGALHPWVSSNINWLQPSPDPPCHNSNRAFVQAPGQYIDQHPHPVKVYTLKRTSSGINKVPGMSSSYVEQRKGMSLWSQVGLRKHHYEQI